MTSTVNKDRRRRRRQPPQLSTLRFVQVRRGNFNAPGDGDVILSIQQLPDHHVEGGTVYHFAAMQRQGPRANCDNNNFCVWNYAPDESICSLRIAAYFMQISAFLAHSLRSR